MNEMAFWVTLPIAIGFYFYIVRKERALKRQAEQDTLEQK
jgi:preprotein translocase subunit YajC